MLAGSKKTHKRLSHTDRKQEHEEREVVARFFFFFFFKVKNYVDYH